MTHFKSNIPLTNIVENPILHVQLVVEKNTSKQKCAQFIIYSSVHFSGTECDSPVRVR